MLSSDNALSRLVEHNLNCLGTLTAVARARADVEVVGFDELLLGEYFEVPLTLLTYDQRALGRTAAALLLERIDGATDPPHRVMVPVAVRRLRPHPGPGGRGQVTAPP